MASSRLAGKASFPPRAPTERLPLRPPTLPTPTSLLFRLVCAHFSSSALRSSGDLPPMSTASSRTRATASWAAWRKERMMPCKREWGAVGDGAAL